jgi:dTMP kinase
MVTEPEFPPPTAAHRRLRTVALVGIDGSGKTTQAHRLAASLAAAGLPATYRRNAGGRRWFGRLAAVFGRADAEELLGRRGILFVESVLRWLAIARTLLRRAITGEIAVMDRYAVCQYASLRSHAANLRPTERGRAERFARLAYRIFPAPDVTFVLAVDPAIAYDRIETRGYDHESMEYLTAATAAYRALPEYATFVVIDANATPDEVAAAIGAHLGAWLPAPFVGPVAASGAAPALGRDAAPSSSAPRFAPVPRPAPAEQPVRPAAPVTTESAGATASFGVTAPAVPAVVAPAVPAVAGATAAGAAAAPAGVRLLPDAIAVLTSALLPGPGDVPKTPALPVTAALRPRLDGFRGTAKAGAGITAGPARVPWSRPVPNAAPEAQQPRFVAEHAKAILLAAGPLTAGASTVGHRLTEAVQALV